ncbi:UNVERIFIED_CONTAM: hypothetical protein NCL1_39154 [Trichonephila clavipes]
MVQGLVHKHEVHPLISKISSIPWGHCSCSQLEVGQFLLGSTGATSPIAASRTGPGPEEELHSKLVPLYFDYHCLDIHCKKILYTHYGPYQNTIEEMSHCKDHESLEAGKHLKNKQCNKL